MTHEETVNRANEVRQGNERVKVKPGRLRFCTLVAMVLCASGSFAKTGVEHLADINSMFGNEFKGNPYAEEVFKYISQGMGFVGGDGAGSVRVEDCASVVGAVQVEMGEAADSVRTGGGEEQGECND